MFSLDTQVFYLISIAEYKYIYKSTKLSVLIVKTKYQEKTTLK